MRCQKCQHPNPDENNFCGNCGAPVSAAGMITLKDIVEAGILKAGAELTIQNRGKDVSATLQADGKINYQGKAYDGPLACSIAVRGSVCDSWYCWQAKDPETGQSHGIGHFRTALLRQRAKPS